MCGQLTVYNTYATLSYTNPLFLGFSCYLNVNKEIIFRKREYQKNIKTLGNPVFSRAFFISVFRERKYLNTENL